MSSCGNGDTCSDHVNVCSTLAEVHTHTKMIPVLLAKIDKIHHVLYGNGQMGLCQKVDSNHEYIKCQKMRDEKMMAKIHEYAFRIIVTIIAISFGMFFRQPALEWLKLVMK